MGKGDRNSQVRRPNHSFSFHGRTMGRERGYQSDSDQLESLMDSIRSRCPDDGRCVFSGGGDGGPQMATTEPSAAPPTFSDTSVMINSAAAAAVSNSNCSITIEDQIRNVDKVLKECEHCRKSLEQICRRLDDLNDEVRRYRDFLGYEKARREPALYKTANSDQPTIHNDGICLTIGNLTNQLTREWLEKLKSIHNAMSISTPTASKNAPSPK